MQQETIEMTNESIKSKGFEQQLSELEALVAHMEKGDISLEDSLKSFEKGIKLTRSCQQSLKEAELKVKVLLSENSDEESELKNFEE